MNFHFRSQSDSSDSGIIRYSDEQQSLERLFNPPSEDFIPLRDRNLPPSFFNPTANSISDGQHTTFHARSTSHFEQKPKPNGVHMRTQSVLAPMSSYALTSNGSDGVSNYTASSATSSLMDNTNSNNSSIHQLNGSNNDSINNLNLIPQCLELNLNENETSINNQPLTTTTTVINNNNDNCQQQLHYHNYSSPAYVRVSLSEFLPNQQQEQYPPPPPPPQLPPTVTSIAYQEQQQPLVSTPFQEEQQPLTSITSFQEQQQQSPVTTVTFQQQELELEQQQQLYPSDNNYHDHDNDNLLYDTSNRWP